MKEVKLQSADQLESFKPKMLSIQKLYLKESYDRQMHDTSLYCKITSSLMSSHQTFLELKKLHPENSALYESYIEGVDKAQQELSSGL